MIRAERAGVPSVCIHLKLPVPVWLLLKAKPLQRTTSASPEPRPPREEEGFTHTGLGDYFPSEHSPLHPSQFNSEASGQRFVPSQVNTVLAHDSF